MPRQLPEDRDRLCGACQALKAAGERVKPTCAQCYMLNPYLTPDDDPSVIRAKEFVLQPILRKKKGMSWGPGGRTTERHGTIESLTDNERATFNTKLAFYLARARRRGKPTDGNHRNPYVLAALAVAKNAHVGMGKVRYKSRRRRCGMKGYLARIERSKMLRNAGLPFINQRDAERLARRADWQGVQPEDAPKPPPVFEKSVYNPIE